MFAKLNGITLEQNLNMIITQMNLLALYAAYHFIPATISGCKSYLHCVPKNVYPLMFDSNFGKFGPIFKILTRGDS